MKSSDIGPILELTSIGKIFDSFTLTDIHAELYPGEVHVLVGENGAGKSTLMKLISGYFTQDSGSIKYRGQEVSFSSIHAARKAGIHYLHQELQCFDNLSVAENIFFNQLPGMNFLRPLYNPNMLHSMCVKVFNDFNIDIDPQELMGRLGFAERQLISAVRGFITPADIVIFDEPSSAMNEPDREILFNIIETLKNRGKGIFYISHRMDEIQKVGDRVSVLSRGRLTETCAATSVDHDGLVRLMTGEVHKERFPRIPSKIGDTIMEVRSLAWPPILKDINFTLKRGEILGITGLMGSGRTLLANCLFGNADLQQGEIYIDGIPVQISHPEDAMRAGISLVPEDRVENGMFLQHDLIRNMTSATLKRFISNFVLDDRYMAELSHEYVEELSISPGHSEDLLDRYSGGNQQKVLLSRWLMKRSRIYIMDEPTRGIDAASRVDIYNTMNDLVGRGASIILFSSEIEEILGMSDRILILAGGKISAELSRREASKEKILEYATDDL